MCHSFLKKELLVICRFNKKGSGLRLVKVWQAELVGRAKLVRQSKLVCRAKLVRYGELAVWNWPWWPIRTIIVAVNNNFSWSVALELSSTVNEIVVEIYEVRLRSGVIVAYSSSGTVYSIRALRNFLYKK